MVVLVVAKLKDYIGWLLHPLSWPKTLEKRPPKDPANGVNVPSIGVKL